MNNIDVSKIDNELLNELFPFAACPNGSMNDNEHMGNPWYLYNLGMRIMAAMGMGDLITYDQLVKRYMIQLSFRLGSSDETRKKMMNFFQEQKS